MCLILLVLAAVTATLLWYVSELARKLRISMLCWLFWGAGILWFVDLCFAYARQGVAVLLPTFLEIVQDTLLGLAVITFALVLWLADLLIRDPLGRFAPIWKKPAEKL